jgi:hypothetical protein
MKHIMRGLDPNTWRPITSEEEHENDNNANIDDKDSGWLFRQGLKLHCPDVGDCDPRSNQGQAISLTNAH